MQQVLELSMDDQTAEIYKFPDSAEREIREKRGAQLEDGFTRTANALVEAFMKAPLTSREARVIRAFERATFGWNRSSAWLAASVLSNMTGMPEGKCSEALNSLIRKRVLIRQGGSRSPCRINTVVSEWNFEAEKSRVTPKRKANPKRGDLPQDGVTQIPQNGVTNKDRKDINPLTTFEGGAYEAEPTQKPKAKSPAKPKGYPEPFEACWQEYPKREGSNPKNRAFTGWKARIKEGVTEDEMLAGTKRYAAFIRAKGDENTAFVMQAQRFFGPSREFENPWSKPSVKPSWSEPANPQAEMDDCAGKVYIPGPPPDADTWRGRQ